MTESAGNLSIGVKVDTKDVSKGIQRLQKSFDGLVKHAQRAAIAISAAVVGIAAVSVKAASKQEDALLGLQAALSNTGDATQSALKDFSDFAAEIQKVTIFGDEETLALIALQKNLGVSTDELQKATKMTIGLAAATGRNVESMGTYVALALQGETTMLRRYIPALRQATSKTEELEIITKFAANGFKIAEARSKTTSGQFIQMKNTLGDLAESFGQPLLQPLSELFGKLKTFLEDNQDEVKQWGKIFAGEVEKAAKVTVKLFNAIGGVEGILKTLKGTFIAIGVILAANAVIWGIETAAIIKNTAAKIANVAASRAFDKQLGLTAVGGGFLVKFAGTLKVVGIAILGFITSISLVGIAIAAAIAAVVVLGVRIAGIIKLGNKARRTLGGEGVVRSESGLKKFEEMRRIQKITDVEEKKAALEAFKVQFKLGEHSERVANRQKKALEDVRELYAADLKARKEMIALQEKHLNLVEMVAKVQKLNMSLSNKQLQVDRLSAQFDMKRELGARTGQLFTGLTTSGESFATSESQIFGSGQKAISKDANFIAKNIQILNNTIKQQTKERNKMRNTATGAAQELSVSTPI